ncbi:MAG TPA: hypothetical protein VMV93_08520, partial [Chloroflexota bacterium]|nr:hypothetical protein [Chloroflexota bacterium]
MHHSGDQACFPCALALVRRYHTLVLATKETRSVYVKNMMLALAAAGLLAAPSGALAAQPQPAPAAPAACDFILGFKTLQALDPGDMGTCLDNQAFASNGDALQHTTKGLMVWRKSDNWTAFTNGYTTWINGPDGLVSRLNTTRFPWEKDPIVAPTPSPTPVSAPIATPSAAPSGSSSATPAFNDFSNLITDMKAMVPEFPLRAGTFALAGGVSAACTGSSADVTCNESNGDVVEQVTASDGSTT